MTITYQSGKKASNKIKKGGYHEIQKLPEGDRIKVEHMLFSGYSAPKVAEYMQKELGCFKGVPLNTASRTVRIFKARVVRPKACGLLHTSPRGNTKAERAMSEQRNVAVELNWVVELQKTRIAKVQEEEEESGETDKTLNKEISLYLKALETLGKFQIDVGMMPHAKHFHKGKHINPQVIDLPPELPELSDELKTQLAEATKKAMKLLSAVDHCS